MAKSHFLRDLLRAYPTVGLQFILTTYEKWGEDDKLLEELDAAEAVASKAKRESEAKWKAIGDELVLREKHRHLNFLIDDSDVDLEHVQAILMHGLIAPGRSETYAGKHVIGEEKLKENVRNKLSRAFSHNKYVLALEYLKKNKIVLVTATSGQNEKAFSLNVACVGTTAHGKQIVRVCTEYLRVHKKYA